MTAGRIARIADVKGVPDSLAGSVVAIGNFDGVHRGHQVVLDRASAIAHDIGAPLVCLTFEPHPRTVFRPDAPVKRLTPAPMKARLLECLAFDAVVEQTFNPAFAGQSPDTFVDDVLLHGLRAAHIVAGFDFHYGSKRAGTPKTLRAAGATRGFGVTLVDALFDKEGEVVSSTRIRKHLQAGEMTEANDLLAYRWTIRGEVIHGRKLGRTLGYPTANLVLADEDILQHGVYAVRVKRQDGQQIDGVASFGRRPTFDDGAALFETYLFDFSDDLYGETIEVSIFSFLRGEERFAKVDALVAQMDRDASHARARLANVVPLSHLDERIAFGRTDR